MAAFFPRCMLLQHQLCDLHRGFVDVAASTLLVALASGYFNWRMSIVIVALKRFATMRHCGGFVEYCLRNLWIKMTCRFWRHCRVRVRAYLSRVRLSATGLIVPTCSTPLSRCRCGLCFSNSRIISRSKIPIGNAGVISNYVRIVLHFGMHRGLYRTDTTNIQIHTATVF